MKKIVVVAPTFNEEENIANFLEKTLDQDSKFPGYDVIILVSDSHSSDRTAEIVQSFSKKDKRVILLDVKERGLGHALTMGLDYAVSELDPEILVTMEADLSNDPSGLVGFISKLETADLVVGSRYAPGGKIVNWTWWRRFFSFSANLGLKTLVGKRDIYEYTNLYRVFKKNVWLKIRSRVAIHKDWVFVTAFILEALRTDSIILEQPITYKDRAGGRSKMRTIAHTKNLTQYALGYRFNRHGTLS